MQADSARPQFLKHRITAGHGHLSNLQSLAAIRRLLDRRSAQRMALRQLMPADIAMDLLLELAMNRAANLSPSKICSRRLGTPRNMKDRAATRVHGQVVARRVHELEDSFHEINVIVAWRNSHQNLMNSLLSLPSAQSSRAASKSSL